MGKRWSWVAWSMLAIFVISLVLGFVLAIANGTVQQDATNQAMLFVGFSAFMVVGALVVAHRPGNASAGSSRPSPCWLSSGNWQANTLPTPM